MVDAERGQCGVDYLVSRVVSEFMKPLIKERQEREKKEGIDGARRGLLTAFPYKERAGGGKRRRRRRGWRKTARRRRKRDRRKGVIRGDTMRDTREEERNLEGEIKTGG